MEYVGFKDFKPTPTGKMNEGQIDDFKILGFNKSQTQFGYMYTHGEGQNKAAYYIMMSMDEKGNVTYKFYNNEKEFNRTRDDW